VRNALLNSLVLIPALVAAQTPVLEAAPVSVSFVATGQGQPPAQQIRIRNTGSGSLQWRTISGAQRRQRARIGGGGGWQPLDWKASTDAAWLTVLPADGTSPGIIQVEVSAEALAPGTYVATVTVMMEGAPNSPARIPVQATLQR
jgi:hypothetical protein